jgi:hypothetical protein
MKLYVKSNERCIDSKRSPEQFGDWYEELDFSVTGVCLSRPDREEYFHKVDEIEVPFDAKVGDRITVLYIVYRTGDSFGYSVGNGEVIWAFHDGSAAVQALRAFEKQEHEYSVEFDDGFGNVVKMSNPAAGYFEDLTLIDTETFTLER